MPSAICPICRGASISVERRQVTLPIKGVPVSFWEEMSRCDGCGETFYTREQSMASSRAHAAAVRKAEGSLSPEAIREARIELGMTQEQFEAALGVGKKTVVRWERGTVAPSSAANGLLWLAGRYPSVFLEYARERLAGGEPAPTQGARVIARIEQASDPTSTPRAVRFEEPKIAGKSIQGRVPMGTVAVLQTSGASAAGGQS